MKYFGAHLGEIRIEGRSGLQVKLPTRILKVGIAILVVDTAEAITLVSARG